MGYNPLDQWWKPEGSALIGGGDDGCQFMRSNEREVLHLDPTMGSESALMVVVVGLRVRFEFVRLLIEWIGGVVLVCLGVA